MNTWSVINNLEAIRTYLTAGNPVWNVDEIKETCDMAIEALKQTEWIPVSERLPENNDSVIVTWVNHNPEVYYKDITDKPFTATAHYHNGRWYWYSTVTKDYLDEYGTWEPDLVDEDIEIIAWMPLPEPPKMEGEQE